MDYHARLQPSRRHVVRSRVGRPDPRERTGAAHSAFDTTPPPMPPEIGPREEALPTASVPTRARGNLRRRAEEGKVGLAILLWLLGVPGLLVLLYLLFA